MASSNPLSASPVEHAASTPQTRAQCIEQLLVAALAPSHLEVINESQMHNVPPGAESHFRVVVVTRSFQGKTAVMRHRLVYSALQTVVAGGLHALALTARTPEEWAAAPEAPHSPPCSNG
jgi:stress-induced morphogen